jgi:tRNA nucleotidyltransferase (CCA-adding enzyme)
MEINIPSNVKFILDKLNENGFEAYIVGGCVRDSIMNREPNDWDITTNAKPNEVESIFEKTIPTGIKHGTITVMVDNVGYEVTTYRIDGEYKDNRTPKSVAFTNSLKEDLSRRDFTINAMAYNETEGMIDYFGGIEDIRNKVIRCVGNADERFYEDALRMLRAVRFSAQFDFDIDSKAVMSMYLNSKHIINISSERIQIELNKILLSENVFKGINELWACDLLPYILTEVYGLTYIPQDNPYHKYNVYKHTLYATDYIENKLHLKLAALFHDLGKAETRTKDENGIDHFYGHEVESVRLAENILKRLRYDNETIKKVLTLIKYHSRRVDATPKAVKRFLNQLGDYDVFNDWVSLRWADILAQNPKYLKPRVIKISEIEKIAEKIMSEQQPFSVKDLEVNGHDLIALGYKGKEIGTELNRLLEIVIDNQECNHKEYLIMKAKEKI